MNVKEFAARAGLSPHTVRYYEKVGLLGEVQRLDNGHRHFCENDIEWVRFVQRLKDTGMPLQQILLYADLRARGEATFQARLQLLEAHETTLRENLARQQLHLDKLKEKIGIYRAALGIKNACLRVDSKL